MDADVQDHWHCANCHAMQASAIHGIGQAKVMSEDVLPSQ